MRFFYVDVFTDRPYAGNPLALFFEEGGLGDTRRQALTRCRVDHRAYEQWLTEVGPGYLCHHEIRGPGPLSGVFQQGVEMGRPSSLHFEARAEGGTLSVRVGGTVVPIAEGSWAT